MQLAGAQPLLVDLMCEELCPTTDVIISGAGPRWKEESQVSRLSESLHDHVRVTAISMAWVRASWGRTDASGRAFLTSSVVGDVNSMM